MNTRNMLTRVALGLVASASLAIDAHGQRSTPVDETGLTLNFRDVPLEMVLDYFSEAAGYVIMTETDVSGTVNVWSKTPLDRSEAVDLLDAILSEKGYAAVRKGQILKIVDRSAAVTENLPVRMGANPEGIPENDAMVTQVIPVGYTEAPTLLEDLSPLIPETATITSNESSNTIVMTDTQNNIRRFAEIIAALDSSISGISQIKVYPLVHSDAVELAELVTELFEVEESNDNRGRGGPGAFFGRGGDRGGDRNSGSTSEARQAASRVIATADERTNALVVSAPEAFIPTIDQLVAEVDTNVSELTSIEVFRLEFADATETAELITELFDDSGSSGSSNTGGRFSGFFGRFPGGPGGDRGGQQNNNNDESQRMEAQNTVVAVADQRTNSIIVTAGSSIMPEISQMVARLDSDDSKRQKVFVYNLDHADVDNVALILRSMFERDDGSFGRNTSNRSGQQENNPLNNRQVSVDGVGAQAGGAGGRFQ